MREMTKRTFVLIALLATSGHALAYVLNGENANGQPNEKANATSSERTGKISIERSGGTFMESNIQTAPVSKKTLWAGRIISGLLALFLVFDSVLKFAKPAPVVEGTIKLGYPESVILTLGIVLLTGTVLYLIPPTSVLGAILLTGYLGGAVATHVRVGDPLFTHVLFPVYVGVLLWLGLYLRDGRLRALVPLRSKPAR